MIPHAEYFSGFKKNFCENTTFLASEVIILKGSTIQEDTVEISFEDGKVSYGELNMHKCV